MRVILLEKEGSDMITFRNDYAQVAAPEILNRLAEIQNDSFIGYGLDKICETAADKIKKQLGRDDVDVHFLVGGTQANLTMIDQMLKPWQAVVAVDSGHINVHESASVEATGHKVEVLPPHEGKMSAADLEKLAASRTDEHMIRVGAVDISNSTEIGTIYSKAELLALRKVCDKYGLYLYVDGARMGAALTSRQNDLTLKDFAEICDCFYIGATKNGGMIGEAVVIINDDLKPGFRNMMKQKGALMAKGFILGVQYDCLFTDDLFFRLAKHENEVAEYLVQELKKLNIRFFMDSPTNQQFIYLKNEVIEQLKKKYEFEMWEIGEEESVIRLVTSFMNKTSDVDSLVSDLKELL